MNIGLHEPSFYTSRTDLPKLVDTTNKLSERFGTKFIIHSPTFVNETVIAGKHNIFNNVSLYQMSLARELIPNWTAVSGIYLNVFNITKKLHGMNGRALFGLLHGTITILPYLPLIQWVTLKGRDGRSCSRDGVHIMYICNYRALVTQWDFNWLVTLGTWFLLIRLFALSMTLAIYFFVNTGVFAEYTESGKILGHEEDRYFEFFNAWTGWG